ncbi:MAG TPA: APC family permease [Thermoanaerobaculia bacterium]|nr:APC family permease [Thermoanaerobaculia bacterium]
MPARTSLIDRLLGRPLASSQQEGQKVGVLAGLPIFGLDGLSSAAYGPEAALAILIPLGAAGLAYIGPITLVILGLLAILYFSYRQTIAAYPGGGGSYTVAKDNLGTRAGLLAAAALMLDYILNVAVGISAGVGALISAVPALHAHILALCLAILVIITLINLRGVREPGLAFAFPTYAFVGSLATMLAVGVVKTLAHGGHPVPAEPLPALPPPLQAATLWLMLRSFASGCTAMTGVEAVSNGITAFEKPAVRNAQRTLTAIVAILAMLLGGIAYLVRAYGIGAMDQEKGGYQSVLSQLAAAVLGRGVFYYLTLGSVLAVLALSANTSFADFPRLCRMVAEDGYLPRMFANVGRRLVYSSGIVVLALLAGLLMIFFGGITDRLIPLFAVGAFSAFSLSQAGMVVHWRRRKGGGGRRAAMAVNGVGAAATAAALAVILVAKFVEGAWVTVAIVPLLLAVFSGVKRHYRRVLRQIARAQPIDLEGIEPPVVVVPLEGWNQLSESALRFALALSGDVVAVHVAADEAKAQSLRELWEQDVEEPIRRAHRPLPRLEIIPSPYRRLFTPLLDFVTKIEKEHPTRQVAVIIPELVQRRWYEYLLHNHRAEVMKALLLIHASDRLVVINIPWCLR